MSVARSRKVGYTEGEREIEGIWEAISAVSYAFVVTLRSAIDYRFQSLAALKK